MFLVVCGWLYSYVLCFMPNKFMLYHVMLCYYVNVIFLFLFAMILLIYTRITSCHRIDVNATLYIRHVPAGKFHVIFFDSF